MKLVRRSSWKTGHGPRGSLAEHIVWRGGYGGGWWVYLTMWMQWRARLMVVHRSTTSLVGFKGPRLTGRHYRSMFHWPVLQVHDSLAGITEP